MLQLKNETPFAAAINLFPDPEGIDTLYVTLKATFAIEDGQPAVAEEQVPVGASSRTNTGGSPASRVSSTRPRPTCASSRPMSSWSASPRRPRRGV